MISGSAAATGLLALGLVAGSSPATAAASQHESSHVKDVVRQMEDILGADGTLSGKVLEVDVSRSDITGVTLPHGVPVKDGFQLQHEFYFQNLSGHHAIFNGDFSLRPSETNRVIDALQANHLTFQAFHQHLYDLSPMVWFIHARGTGDPIQLARELRAVENVTSTPLPQSSPANPTTPLPADQLAKILGGDAKVGENGVVTVTVPRTDRIHLAGHRIDPDLGVSSNIQFEPLGGDRAAVVPDFSMTANEVPGVTAVMRGFGWDDGCLYNQETAEKPQLYFSHFDKTGDAVSLARQIRRGLDRTAAQRPSD